MTDIDKCAGELPERDQSRPAEQQGVFRKFIVTRTDGKDAPGCKHHGCEYFVLDVNHDRAVPAALAAYADAIEPTHPVLASDIRNRYALRTVLQSAQPTGEAVAWHVRCPETGYETLVPNVSAAEKFKTSGWAVTPLYTSPPDQSARIASLECEMTDVHDSYRERIAELERMVVTLEKTETECLADIREVSGFDGKHDDEDGPDIRAELNDLLAEFSAVKDERDELRRQLGDCAPYLKEDETPAQRIERERGEVGALLTMLAKERRQLEEAQAREVSLLHRFIDITLSKSKEG